MARSPARPRAPKDEVLTPTGGEAGSVLLGRLLALLEQEVRHVIAARREVDPNPDDAFRGLYVTDADVERLLGGGWPALPERGTLLAGERRALELSLLGASGVPDDRLEALALRFGLSQLDLDLLVIALAPDIDSRFERLYGYLNDDVTRRRATIGLALELARMPHASGPARARLHSSAPLVSGGLVLVEEVDRPFLTRSLRVPDRVIAHLLGDDLPAHEIEAFLSDEQAHVRIDVRAIARALNAGAPLIYVRDRIGGAGRALALGALGEIGAKALNVDLRRLTSDTDISALAGSLGREARLCGAGIVAGPCEALGDPTSERARAGIRALSEVPGPVILIGSGGFDPENSSRVPLVVDAPTLERADRLAHWRNSLGDVVDDRQLEEVIAAFRLSPEQVNRASQAARRQADAAGEQLAVRHVRAGAIAQNAAGLERMARRVEPAVGWSDLVLPLGTFRALEELVGRVRHRDRVLGEWKMRPGGGRGQGVTALFAGESGTGKTMSAEVVAGALGLELYTINLATVVDKYVGETEKNLERIFSEVDGVNGVLLFDEADALFGKRSEVRDAHDRYANIEVAYLLQRIESFDGLAILATNLRANVDEAFTRRLDAVVDFPFPDVEQRKTLWAHCLSAEVPLGPDVDLDFLSASFELSGGNIRSIALTAAYLAAGEARELSMADLVRAVHREYRKLGRLSVRSEFGDWYGVIEKELASESLSAPQTTGAGRG